jgi:hypothetical protein
MELLANSTADIVTETSSITALPILANTSDSTNSTLTNTTLSTPSPIGLSDTGNLLHLIVLLLKSFALKNR